MPTKALRVVDVVTAATAADSHDNVRQKDRHTTTASQEISNGEMPGHHVRSPEHETRERSCQEIHVAPDSFAAPPESSSSPPLFARDPLSFDDAETGLHGDGGAGSPHCFIAPLSF